MPTVGAFKVSGDGWLCCLHVLRIHLDFSNGGRVCVSHFLVSCSKGSDESPAPAPPTNPMVSWTFKGAFGGYVPSISFHSSKRCEVWASGDDMSGLYKSTDCGSSWQLISSPKNVSS
jgi:hypothetical protein